ncbi:MAG: IS66 family insertion sequence element accessory protein TnpB [Ruminococcus sp.]|nr:IS66 family insertion sequence element accessory protein TnpB [Ruminococcus sp.]
MIVIRPSEIYISSANVDMRKSIDGLASLVQQRFRLDPFRTLILLIAKMLIHLGLKHYVKTDIERLRKCALDPPEPMGIFLDLLCGRRRV